MNKLLPKIRLLYQYFSASVTAQSIQRSLYGNPYDVNTKSGLSLSEDLKNLIALGYKEIEGVNCDQQSFGDSKDIIYTINEWKTDNYFGMTFQYDLNISISSSGIPLTNEKVADTIKLTKQLPLNQAILNTINLLHSKESVIEAFKH